MRKFKVLGDAGVAIRRSAEHRRVSVSLVWTVSEAPIRMLDRRRSEDRPVSSKEIARSVTVIRQVLGRT